MDQPLSRRGRNHRLLSAQANHARLQGLQLKAFENFVSGHTASMLRLRQVMLVTSSSMSKLSHHSSLIALTVLF